MAKIAKFAAMPIEKQNRLTAPVVTAVRTVRTMERGGAGVCWRGRSMRLPSDVVSGPSTTRCVQSLSRDQSSQKVLAIFDKTPQTNGSCPRYTLLDTKAQKTATVRLTCVFDYSFSLRWFRFLPHSPHKL